MVAPSATAVNGWSAVMRRRGLPMSNLRVPP
jgi:hypothetical protein